MSRYDVTPGAKIADDTVREVSGLLADAYGDDYKGDSVLEKMIGMPNGHVATLWDDETGEIDAAAVAYGQDYYRVGMLGARRKGRGMGAQNLTALLNKMYGYKDGDYWITIRDVAEKVERVVISSGMVAVRSVYMADKLLTSTGRRESYEVEETPGGVLVYSRDGQYRQGIFATEKADDGKI
jgi:hypothetical protein